MQIMMDPVTAKLTVFYFFWLPVERRLVFSEYLAPAAQIKPSFTNSHPQYVVNLAHNTLYIPIDMHLALSLGWITREEAANNMPYLDETLQAAIALGVSR